MKKVLIKAFLLSILAIVLITSPVLATLTATDQVQGIEIFAGVKVGQYRVGATFITIATGDLPGTLRASVTYTPNEPLVEEGGTNTIVRGNWRLNVFENRKYKGYIKGTMENGGTVDWSIVENKAEIKAQVTVTRVVGSGISVAKGDKGYFEGWLSHNEYPPTIEGTLVLNP